MAFHGDFAAAEQDAARDAGVPAEPDTFGFKGEVFTLRDRIGAMTLMQFAAVAVKGVHASDMEGLAAVYRMLEDVVAVEDWQRFMDVAREHAASDDELLFVIKQAIQVIANRPTVRPSGSPGGPSSTTASSRDDSSPAAPSPLDGMTPVGALVS